MAEQEGYLGSFGRSGGWARDDLAAVSEWGAVIAWTWFRHLPWADREVLWRAASQLHDDEGSRFDSLLISILLGSCGLAWIHCSIRAWHPSLHRSSCSIRSCCSGGEAWKWCRLVQLTSLQGCCARRGDGKRKIAGIAPQHYREWSNVSWSGADQHWRLILEFPLPSNHHFSRGKTCCSF